MEEVKETKTIKNLIANRVPLGDKWELADSPGTIYNNLTDTLEAYFKQSQWRGEFVLAPLEGKLYTFSTETIITKQPEKTFGIYGELKQGI